jgi:hypothetical protein
MDDEQIAELEVQHKEMYPDVTDFEKLDFIYGVALEAKALIEEIKPQVAPLLASLEKNPMLKMFLGKR